MSKKKNKKDALSPEAEVGAVASPAENADAVSGDAPDAVQDIAEAPVPEAAQFAADGAAKTDAENAADGSAEKNAADTAADRNADIIITEDASVGQHDKPKKKGVSTPRIIISLAVICALVAAMLGAVNAVTRTKIADNTEREKELAIQEIFGSGTQIEEYTDFPEAESMQAYLIYKGGMLYGYCADVTSSGFGGPINMMVGVDYTGAVCGVNIVSMSETAGLGSKTNTPGFLEQFVGKIGNLSVGNGIDAISGATISSKAVTAGVNSALAAGIDLAAVAQSKGVSLYSAELDTAPAETTEAVTENAESEAEPAQTKAESSGRLEDTVEYADGIENAPSAPAGERPSANIPVYDDTMVYITETTEPDTDETEETEPDTPETTTKAPAVTTKTPETTTKKPETTKTPETTTKAPETTTKAEETTGPAEETTDKAAETTGPADETE